MYTALASYLFLTTELSSVRLWADLQRIWVLLSLKLDAFYEEFMFFSIFWLKNQKWGEFLCIIGLRNCVREYKTCHSPRSFDLCNETSVFCMDDVFELLSKLCMYKESD